ncbi:MAG TPA: UDP-2,3-diacylglucosamine diphosphatase [Balneolaceae bacterium]|nr:UDP-2,3-diacylglucosamine diphosphatase [Balneolaceae bacterium]
MHHLFISDVHFGAFEEQKQLQIEKDLFSLIDYCEKHSILLHVLGDLFDYWMEFPNYIPPLGKNILARFGRYHNKVGPTLYVTGNHDFWTVGAFEDIGFDVKKNETTITLGKRSVFLMHGDGIEDKRFKMPRPLLNRVLRHPRFVTFFQAVFSGSGANAVMKRFSEFTRDPMDENPEKLNGWAHKLISEHHFDVVITGHDHVERTETFSGGIYINCGAFHKKYTLAEYKNEEFKLVRWNSHQKKLLPFKRTFGS